MTNLDDLNYHWISIWCCQPTSLLCCVKFPRSFHLCIPFYTPDSPRLLYHYASMCMCLQACVWKRDPLPHYSNDPNCCPDFFALAPTFGKVSIFLCALGAMARPAFPLGPVVGASMPSMSNSKAFYLAMFAARRNRIVGLSVSSEVTPVGPAWCHEPSGVIQSLSRLFSDWVRAFGIWPCLHVAWRKRTQVWLQHMIKRL